MAPFAGTAHRPWPLPARPWVLAQRRHDVLFAHWPVPPARLAALVPPPLTVDTLDGAAWVGVVPSRLTRVRLRGCPPLPRLSAFGAVEVRTCVTAGGRPGVFLLSLDAGSDLAVALGRRWLHLPCHRALVALAPAGHRVVFGSRRVPGEAPAAELVAAYGSTGEATHAPPGSLEHWLTERYCVYVQDRAGRLCRSELHHAPWLLQPAAAEIARSSMGAPFGLLLPPAAARLHFARRLDVRLWAPRPVPGAATETATP